MSVNKLGIHISHFCIKEFKGNFFERTLKKYFQNGTRQIFSVTKDVYLQISILSLTLAQLS